MMMRADDGDLLGVRVVRAARQAGGPGVGAAEARRARPAAQRARRTAVSFAPSTQVSNIRHYRIDETTQTNETPCPTLTSNSINCKKL